MNKNHITADEKGFTIIELMIATVVSVTLIFVFTIGILQITKVYYKGITSSTTQIAARNVMDAVAQAIEFSKSAPSPGTPPHYANSYCMGHTSFYYSPGVETGTLYSGILQDDNNNCNGAPSSASRQLLGPHMRLTQLTILPIHVPGGKPTYQVTVGVAYGDDDLLCSNGHPLNKCDMQPSSPPPLNFTGGDVQCRGTAGDQFCWVTNLTTSVSQRLQ